jgi:hypothetical protein
MRQIRNFLYIPEEKNQLSSNREPRVHRNGARSPKRRATAEAWFLRTIS